MLVAFDLDRYYQTLDMSQSEEGEISELTSIKEVNNQRGSCMEVGSICNNEPMREKAKVWPMQDHYKYQLSRIYGSDLYNLAWAQGVQNKSRNEVSVLHDNNSNDNKITDIETNNGGGVKEPSNDKVVIDLSSGDDDDEKEEGELEEGEIDFSLSDSDFNKSEFYLKDNKKEFEQRIDIIRVAFDSVTTSNSEESYDAACYRIKNSLDSLWEVILEDSSSNTNELVELAYGAIKNLNNTFNSMSPDQQEQNKHSLSRLLLHVTSQNPPLFATEQMKEIEYMIKSLEFDPPLLFSRDTTKQNKIQNVDEEKKSLDFTKLETNNFQNRGMLLPLLDLHKEHDEDSLPSPTRDAPRIMPGGDASFVKPEWPAPLAPMPYYETDSLKAISNYQQKFGQNSLFTSDLPSPTPSEDGDEKIGDTSGDVSSSPQQIVSSSSPMDICNNQVIKNNGNAMSVKPKSRDPRLRKKVDTVSSRVSNGDSVGLTTGSKKKKPTDEPVSILPISKRQKNSPTDLGTTAISSITNIIKDKFENSPGTSIGNNVSLENIIKDITANPAAWLNLIKMEQQKLILDPVKNSVNVSSSNSVPGEISTVNKPSMLGKKSEGILQTLPPTTATDELKKIRMKHRDPRLSLHNNKVQKNGNSIPSNTKIISPSISSSRTPTVPHVNPQVPSPQPSQNVSEPLNNKNGIISSSEEVSTSPSHSKSGWGEVEHLFEGLDEKQKAAFHKERARRIDEQKKMFSARKLCLVLDLDHTLLNSAKFVEVDPVHDEILRKKEDQDRENQHRHLFRFPHMGMWTKLRPGIWNFLEKASKLFELHLYTMGNKLYATEMAKLLDPKGTLFSGRVISRGDNDEDGDVSKSKDLEGVLGMESGVVIIDDSIRVWPHNKLNLIVVERYIYFPCSRRQFGLLGPSLLEIDHDERPEAGTLASSLAVIEKIHEIFFAHRCLDEADVRNILASQQRKILGGCRILFSRVFPIGETNPHLHPLWQTAEQFGAICTNHIDDKVTHVVANSLGTDKVNWALSTGRSVVHPGWVEASALLYRRANEQDFAIKP